MRVLMLMLFAGLLTFASLGCTPQSADKRAAGPGAPASEAGKDRPPGDALGADWDFGDKADAKKSDKGVATPTPGDSTAAEKSATAKAKEAPSEKAPAEPPPAVAEAMVGTAKNPKRPQELPSGVLTAGSFDDNLDPDVFHKFVAKRGQSRGLGDLPRQMVGQRLMVTVRDGGGKPVGNARVRLSAQNQAVELVTRSDGRAVFMLPFDQMPPDQELTAKVTPPHGGAAVTEKIAAGSQRWDVALPGAQAQIPKNLDFAIVLDTTASMQDEINHLKAEIRGISAALKKQFPQVQQRFALILYRDYGDDYVVRTFDFTTSLDSFHKNIAAQSAAGGGDYPEAMHEGLEAANKLSWQEDDTARVMFLIADAPPHSQHMNRTLTAANNLRKKGVAIYPVACSGYDDHCEFVMRSCALLTGGQFLFLTDDSGVGGAHAEPKVPYFKVERLERLMLRMVASELSGQRIEPNPEDVIRSVGQRKGN